MGFIRIFKLGIVAGFRNKRRVLPITFLFLILFSVVTYQLSKIESYSTDSLISSRGVVIEVNGDYSSAELRDAISSMREDVREYIAALFVVYYVDIIPGQIGAIAVRAYQGVTGGFDWRWVVDEVKPTRIVDGRHIQGKGEVIVNSGYSFSGGGGGISVNHTLSPVGSTITLTSDDKRPLSLKIVGVYNKTQPGFSHLSGGVPNLLVMTWDDFSDFVTRIWPDPAGDPENADYVYVRRLVFISKGDLMSGSNLEYISSIKEKLTDSFGGDDRFILQSTQNIDPNAFRGDLIWGFTTILFSLVLAFLYSFILVRFKSRDIATLRALGWRRLDVLGFSLGELFLIISVSYILSLLAIYFYMIAFGFKIAFSTTVLLESVGVALLTLIFGFIIVNFRVTRIPPEKAFREG